MLLKLYYTLLCLKPYWSVIQKNGKFLDFVKDYIFIRDDSQVLRHGMFKGSLLGSKDFNGGFWALKIES